LQINTLEVGSPRIVSAIDGKEENPGDYFSSNNDQSLL